MVGEDARASLKNPLFQEIMQKHVGKIKAAGTPLYFSKFERGTVKPAPELGDDNAEILGHNKGHDKG